MGNTSHEQADLLLKLYDLRREPRLREARKFMVEQFNATTMEEFMRQCPPGSDQNASLRQALTYWEMCANLVNRGLIDEEFFFENSGEQFAIFEKVRWMVPIMREQFKSPFFLAELEKNVDHLIAWREKRAPGSNEALKNFMAQMQKQAKAAGH
ncbi:MAG: hypothetical protein HY046_00035 [Acidobacteria bacterium]|nr:hypothetical protein [Acidobacteriota bacterium]